MFCRVLSSAIYGIGGVPVYIELDISTGMPVFNIIGSVSTKVKEAQDRVKTALKNMEIHLPPNRITVSLSPGDIRKDGTRFDLPIAAAILIALDKISESSLSECMLIGELHLNGDVEGVPGVLPSVIAAKESGAKVCIVPYENAAEASNVNGMKIIGLKHLSDLIDYCNDTGNSSLIYKPDSNNIHEKKYPDFKDIKGQSAVKRAALIAAAGFHNILMCGPPGSGKSMTAARIPSILPDLTRDEQLEVSKIYSVAGLLSSNSPIITRRPFRSPHHSLSVQALCGGGRIPQPGEITLAHRGVLFIDELPEMPGRTLEQLRTPMEEHSILISRAAGSYRYPSHFLFAAAMNPCPCGNYPDMNKCTCSLNEIRSYLTRISRPVLDRIDIRVTVPALSYQDLTSSSSDELGSTAMKTVVSRAFDIQRERYAKDGICFNSELDASDIKRYCETTDEAKRILEKAFSRMSLSARAYHRILKLSRTIADIEDDELITEAHVSEAFAYRNRIEIPQCSD